VRRWGIVITTVYALIVLMLVGPFIALITKHSSSFYQEVRSIYSEWLVWVLVAAFVAGEALLLFVSVDTARQRMKPRTHVLVSCAMGAMLFALLVYAAVCSVGFGIHGDKFGDDFFESRIRILSAWGVLWLLWGIILYVYLRGYVALVTRIVSWLLKGSVLELLVAVPCHVIVRRRGDCCAPTATGLGIATGIAIMLLSFGPGVLFLYKKRLDSYSKHRPDSA